MTSRTTYISSLFAAWILYAPCAYAQDMRASASMDTSVIRIGEQAKITLRLSIPAGNTFAWPIIRDTLSSHLEIVNRLPLDTSYDSTRITTQILTQQLVITSFDSGYFPIPPFQFAVGNDTIETQPLLLTVLTVEVDTSKAIFDIKQPIQVAYTFLDWLKENWQWPAIALLLAAIMATAVYFWKKRKKIPEVIQLAKPVKPPHILAMEKLNMLKNKKLWQQGKHKAYHTELSDILREYIENRYHFNACEQTSLEIMYRLRQRLKDESLIGKTETVLFLADMVKFAKAQPLATENEQSMSSAMEFVQGSKPDETENEAVKQKEKDTNSHA